MAAVGLPVGHCLRRNRKKTENARSAFQRTTAVALFRQAGVRPRRVSDVVEAEGGREMPDSLAEAAEPDHNTVTRWIAPPGGMRKSAAVCGASKTATIEKTP